VSSEPRPASGRLFYVMGASGAGKDRLLKTVLAHDDLRGRVRLALRSITRPPHSEHEDHRSLSQAEFRAREQAGDFVLAWNAHGLRYGIGREIEPWLADGIHVLVNGSRAYLGKARTRFQGCLVPILVEAPLDTLKTRLAGRGREQPADVQARLVRHERLDEQLPEGLIRIDNGGSLDAAVQDLIRVIQQETTLLCV